MRINKIDSHEERIKSKVPTTKSLCIGRGYRSAWSTSIFPRILTCLTKYGSFTSIL